MTFLLFFISVTVVSLTNFFVITSSFNKCVWNTMEIINMAMHKQLILCSNVVSAQQDIYLPSVLLLIPVVKEQK